MPKVKVNPIIEQIRGAVGDLVFKRYGDKIVLARKPDLSGQTPTEAQLAHRERFREAAVYGKMVMADPAAKAIYEEAAKAKGQPVFSVTLADFFNAPSVDEIDLSHYAGQAGDSILIRAHDDFEVTGVSVEITDANGGAIESGAAGEKPAGSGHWTYTATQAVPTGKALRIAVTATDRPGHQTVKTETKS